MSGVDAEFAVSECEEQRQLHVDPFHCWMKPAGQPAAEFYRFDGVYLVRFPGLADFKINEIDWSVRCMPVFGVADASLKHLYLNQVMPLLLSRQGKLVLHGSAIEVDDHCVAFVGKSGKGKSTLAASFATNGHRFLTDDGLVLESEAGGYLAVPSHPSIRLWADSESFLLAEGEVRAPRAQFTTKERFLASERVVFCDQRRRLQAVYFLGEGRQDIQISEIKPREVLMELVKNSFLLETRDNSSLVEHFQALGNLSVCCQFYRLDYCRDYSALGDVRQAVLSHVKEGVK